MTNEQIADQAMANIAETKPRTMFDYARSAAIEAARLARAEDNVSVVMECYRKLKTLAREQGPDFAKESHMLGVAASYLMETREDIVAAAIRAGGQP